MAKIVIETKGQLAKLKNFLNDKSTPNTLPLAKKAVEGGCKGAATEKKGK